MTAWRMGVEERHSGCPRSSARSQDSSSNWSKDLLVDTITSKSSSLSAKKSHHELNGSNPRFPNAELNPPLFQTLRRQDAHHYHGSTSSLQRDHRISSRQPGVAEKEEGEGLDNKLVATSSSLIFAFSSSSTTPSFSYSSPTALVGSPEPEPEPEPTEESTESFLSASLTPEQIWSLSNILPPEVMDRLLELLYPDSDEEDAAGVRGMHFEEWLAKLRELLEPYLEVVGELERALNPASYVYVGKRRHK